MQRKYRFSERGILLKELDNTVGQLKQKEKLQMRMKIRLEQNHWVTMVNLHRRLIFK